MYNKRVSEVIILGTIADRVAAIIKESGLTQSKFAARLHIGQSQISAFCSGSRAPTDRVIADICREFGIDEHWLRTGEGEMRRRVPDTEALAAQLGAILRDVDPDFAMRLISELVKIPPEAWPLIATFARRITASGDEKEETGQ